MYYLPSNCFICLKNEDSPTIELRNAKNNKVEQITYVLPELVNFYTKINVCSECYTTLQSFYIFKKKCLKNCNYIKNYVSTLQISKNDDKQGECDFKIKVNKNELVTRLDKEKTVEINDDDVHIKEEVVEQPVFVSCGTEIHNAEHDSNIVKVKEEPVFGESQEQMDTDECFVKQEPEVNIVDINEDNEIEDISSSAEDNTNFHEDSSEENSKTTVQEARKLVSLAFFPEKSKSRYERCYQIFIQWCDKKKVKNVSENVLLAYFTELVSQNKKSLWAIYSMLKSCLIIYKNTDISKYSKLIAYLKRKTKHFKPKKSKGLEEDHINLFINQAPDNEYLMMKVVLIIGVSGALRREELYKLAVKDVEIKNEIIIITIPEIRTNISRQFVITNSKWVGLVQKYLETRLTASKIKDRFFLKYQKGRCINIPVGINTIGSIPSKIAKYCSLDNCQEYTGHCFRRSSATLLVNRGGDMLALKRHGGWKSATVM